MVVHIKKEVKTEIDIDLLKVIEDLKDCESTESGYIIPKYLYNMVLSVLNECVNMESKFDEMPDEIQNSLSNLAKKLYDSGFRL